MEHKHITLVNEQINEENEETINESIYKGNSCEPSKKGDSHNVSVAKQR